MDQGEGNFIPAARNRGGGAFSFGESQLESGWFAGVGDLVFLSVLLLCVLRDREVCGLQLQVFRAVVICLLFDAFSAETMKMSGKSLVSRHQLCSESSQMRPLFPCKFSSLKPVLAGLLAALFVGMLLIGASERLHLQLHADDEGHGHAPCAVCAIVKGQVDAPTVTVSEVFASLSVAWTLPLPQAVTPVAVDLSTAPNRGPPASVSSQS